MTWTVWQGPWRRLARHLVDPSTAPGRAAAPIGAADADRSEGPTARAERPLGAVAIARRVRAGVVSGRP